MSRRFERGAATEWRLVGALAGLISIFLPWGSVIYREGMVTMLIIAHNPLNLLSHSSALLTLGSALFISCTMLAFIERWAAVGMLAGVATVAIALPDLLRSYPVPGWLTGEDVSVQIMGYGVGMALGAVSAAVVLASLLVERRQGRFPVEETLPNDQRPVVRYDHMAIDPRSRKR